MTISELIKELEAAKKYCGDIRVVDTQDTWNDYFDFYPEAFKVVIDNNEPCLSLRGEC